MDPLEMVTSRMVSRELYAKGVANRITRQLQQLEIALSNDLSSAMARLSLKDEDRYISGNYTTDRLKKLIAVVTQFSIDWAKIVREQLESGAIDLIEAEIEFERAYLATFAADAGLAVTLDAAISPRQIFNGAKRRPMATKLMKDMFPDMSRNVKRRVTDSLRVSYQASESVGQAVTRMRKELDVNRRGAEMMVRTGLAHYSHNATMEAFAKMGVEKIIWISTLDKSTSPLCRKLDGEIFRVDDPRKPSVPRHARCRSSVAAWLGDDDMDDGERASKGADGAKPVPAAMDYESWLRKQPKAFAREILGPTQYRIWASGVSLKSFSDKYATRVYTAKELKSRYSSLFKDTEKKAA